MLDSHIHLEQYSMEFIEDSVDRWREAGIKGVIAVSNDLASSYRTLELKAKFPDFVHAGVGFHPEYPLPSDVDYLEWEKLITLEKENITAIGEIGLPHYNVEQLPARLEQYHEFLSRCLDVAVRHELPVALHAVHDKAELVYNLLLEKQTTNAHFHWLKAPSEVVSKIVESGYYISLAPEVCYRTRDEELAKQVPLSQLLIETDGPWQYDKLFKDKPTSPLLLKPIIEKLSELHGMSFESLKEQIFSNTLECYRI